MIYNSGHARAYSKMIRSDPIKTFAQRPQAIELLRPLEGKTILDIGCGDGTISRMMAKEGAHVVGYDASKAQIGLARKSEQADQQGIGYVVSTPETFSHNGQFDKALAVMVLCYSKDKTQLQTFFSSTYSLLKRGGSFVVLDMDWDHVEFGKNHFGRIFTPLGNGKGSLEFRIRGTRPFKVVTNIFLQSELESCASAAGFRLASRERLMPSGEGIQELGRRYWQELDRFNYWSWLIFKK